MGTVRNVLDEGLGGLEHNFLTGRVEDLVGQQHLVWPVVQLK